MLEMGMSLIAVNIPSMWLLLSHIVPEKITRGLQSMTSLSSLSSGRNSNRAYEKQGSVSSSRPSETSYIYNEDVEAQKTEVYATPSKPEAVLGLPVRSIQVENSVSLHDEHL